MATIITSEERSVVHSVAFGRVRDSMGGININWRLILELLLNKHVPN